MNDENLGRLANLTIENWGRIVGLDLMARALFTKWALETDDPLAFVAETQAGLIQSMVTQQRLDDSVEAQLINHAESQIDDTFENVRVRVVQALSG